MLRLATSFLALLLGSAAAGCSGMLPHRMNAAERSHLTEAPVIHSVHYEPIDRLQVATLGGGVETWEKATGSGPWIALEDPVARVEAGFLAGLQREMGLANIRRFDRPLPSGHVPAVPANLEVLRLVFDEGLVLDFESTAWRLAFVSRNLLDSAKTTYGLDFVVRVRLVRLPDQVLWHEVCAWTKEEAHRPLGEVMADGATALRALREEIIATCAEELLGMFMGRAVHSPWTGRAVPASR